MPIHGMKIKTGLLLLFIIASSGCGDPIERFDTLHCGPSSTYQKFRFYSVNTNGENLRTLQPEWVSHSKNSDLKIYDLDASKDILYYTSAGDRLNAPVNIVQLNYKDGIVEDEIQLDLDYEWAKNFKLSPNGQWFAFQAYVEGKWQVRLINIQNQYVRTIPQDSSLSNTIPRWLSNQKLIYDSDSTAWNSSTSSAMGLHLANLKDSTFKRFTPKLLLDSYDIDRSTKNIVIGGQKEEEDGGLEEVVYRSSIGGNKAEVIASGNSPQFVDSKNIIYYTSKGINRSNLEGDSEVIYTGDFNKAAISPDGNTIGFIKTDGLYKVDIATKERVKILSPDIFLPEEEGNWSSIEVRFNGLIFTEGDQINVAVIREYSNSGC